MTPRMRIGIGLVAIVTLAAVVGVGLQADARERSSAGEVPAGNRCILCNTSGANQMPRICGSCNNKFNNRCILCNSYGANQVPRICGSCSNKFNNRCILCNSYGAGQAPRICTSCDNKH